MGNDNRGDQAAIWFGKGVRGRSRRRRRRGMDRVEGSRIDDASPRFPELCPLFRTGWLSRMWCDPVRLNRKGELFWVRRSTATPGL